MNSSFIHQYKWIILRIFLVALCFGELNCTVPETFFSTSVKESSLTGDFGFFDVDRPQYVESLTAKYEPIQTIRKEKGEGENIAKGNRTPSACTKANGLQSPFYFQYIRKPFLYARIIKRSVHFNKADYSTCLFAYIHDKDGKKNA